MHRGAAVSIGEPVWAIETQFPGYTRIKVFTSEAGFNAGLRAVKAQIRRSTDPRSGGASGYQCFRIDNPNWQPLVPQP